MNKLDRQLKAAGVIEILSYVVLPSLFGLNKGKDFNLAFCKVDLKKVHYKTPYQRRRELPHIAKILNSFDIRAALPLFLSFRNSKLNCYNGNQTAGALQAAGYEEHIAIVTFDASLKEENKLFYYLNSMPKKVDGWKKFRAALKADEGNFRRLIHVVKCYGLTTPLDVGMNKADIQAASILPFAYNMGGEEMVHKLCAIIVKCWRNPKSKVVQAASKRTDILRGLIMFMAEYDIPEKVICKYLNGISADELRGLANRQKSKGRIDASQFVGALKEICGINRKKAA